jgi:hypothetical protein
LGYPLIVPNVIHDRNGIFVDLTAFTCHRKEKKKCVMEIFVKQRIPYIRTTQSQREILTSPCNETVTSNNACHVGSSLVCFGGFPDSPCTSGEIEDVDVGLCDPIQTSPTKYYHFYASIC